MFRHTYAVGLAITVLTLSIAADAQEGVQAPSKQEKRAEHRAALKEARKEAAQRQKQKRDREKILKERYREQQISVTMSVDAADAAWGRAQIWLSENIRHGIAPIRLVTDTVIQTEKGSTDFQLGVTPEKGVTVTRSQGKTGVIIAVRNSLRVDSEPDKFERTLARYIQFGHPACLEALGEDFSEMLLCFEDVAP